MVVSDKIQSIHIDAFICMHPESYVRSSSVLISVLRSVIRLNQERDPESCPSHMQPYFVDLMPLILFVVTYGTTRHRIRPLGSTGRPTYVFKTEQEIF